MYLVILGRGGYRFFGKKKGGGGVRVTVIKYINPAHLHVHLDIHPPPLLFKFFGGPGGQEHPHLYLPLQSKGKGKGGVPAIDEIPDHAT